MLRNKTVHEAVIVCVGHCGYTLSFVSSFDAQEGLQAAGEGLEELVQSDQRKVDDLRVDGLDLWAFN